MKYFALDWERAFGYLEALGKLTPATRLRLARAELKPVFDTKSLGEDLRVLLATGVVEVAPGSSIVKVTDGFHDTHKLLRALQRVPLLSAPDEELLARYVVEHFDEDERFSLGRVEHAYGFGSGGRSIVARLTSAAHTRELFEGRDPGAWEDALLERMRVLGRGSAPFARLTDEAGADLVLLLGHLLGGPGSVRARELPRLFPELTRARLALAVELGLRYGVLFAGLDSQGEVTLFQWPSVHARLRQGAPPPPTPVKVSESFVLAFALEDLQHLLVRAGDGLRMKASGDELFAAAERELAAGFVELPEWFVGARLGQRFSAVQRVQVALTFALALGFVETRAEERSCQLVVTGAGWEWLERTPRARLADLLELMRAAVERAGSDRGEGLLSLLQLRSSYLVPREDAGRISRALVACFEKLPPGQAVAARGFLLHHACVTNPLLALARKWPERFEVYREEELEERFLHDLGEVLLRALVPWGGVRVGLVRPDELTLELVSVGRYVLGLAPDFELEEAGHEERTPVRVQPDFEVLFVAPSAMLEARIGRFAERRGKGVGVLFRITRDSILAAARSGLDAEEVLTTLSEASATPLPVNVVHEIKAWFARCRRIELESVQLLRCPDEETAERVLVLGARYLERISPTVLALRDASRRAELLRLCAKHGLFLGAARPPRE